MKTEMPLDNYTALKRYIDRAVLEYGPELQRVIVGNEVRLKILEADGIDVNKEPVSGISVITEPFLPGDEVQVVLGQGPPK